MFFSLGDDAFPMNVQLLKPYPRNLNSLSAVEKVFNYRFSRARRTVENSFGLLVNTIKYDSIAQIV